MSAFTLFQDGSTTTTGTEVDGSNPVDFGLVDKGMVSEVVTIDLWNGRNNPSESLSIAPKLYAVPGPGDPAVLFAGTSYNGFKSMLEARSCTGFGVAADEHEVWTPISSSDFLLMGDMPGNTMRGIELRLNVPLDADTLSLTSFALHVSG